MPLGRLIGDLADEPQPFSALRAGDAGGVQPVFTFGLAVVNQIQAVEMLLSYMGSQLAADLMRLMPPRGSS